MENNVYYLDHDDWYEALRFDTKEEAEAYARDLEKDKPQVYNTNPIRRLEVNFGTD